LGILIFRKQRDSGLGNCIDGKVVRVADNGDLVTDISTVALDNAPRDDSVRIAIGPHETVGIFSEDHQEPESTMLAILGNDGHLRVAITGTSMSEMLGIRAGAKVTVCW
jgi:S-adenosyl-L-methionine hydrolase (adenosine-forming)